MTIELKFDRSLVGLAGNPYGKREFEKQVNIDMPADDVVVFVFPDNIRRIASSFVQGFFSRWVTKYGEEYVRSHIEIRTPYPKLVTFIKNNIDA